MDPRELLGMRIRALRLAAGLMVNELAVKADVSASTISRLETGRPICADNLEFVTEALGVTREYILRDISLWEKDKH